jgi:exodeoxyribonuclease V beta subunit
MTALTPYRATAPLADGIALLEASAGTGKTYSIADLYVRLVVERGLEVRTILVVTFTKAATAELRDRIRRRLGQALDAVETARIETTFVPSEEVLAHVVAHGRHHGSLTALARRLTTARESFDEAAVYTIHGFCQRMLQHNAFESGVDFDLELLGDARELITQAVDDFLVRELHDAPPALVQLLKLRKIDRKRLTSLGRLVADHPQLAIEPAPLRQPLAQAFSAWTAATGPVAALWRDQREHLTAALLQATERKILHGAKCSAKRIATMARALTEWFDQGAPPTPEGLVALRYFTPTGLRTACNANKLPPEHGLLDACQTLLDQAQAALDTADGLLPKFCHWLRAELDLRKQARRVQTYSDLLGKLQTGLDGPAGGALRRAIRSQYDAALIDEFQDTDPSQWAIFHGVFGTDPAERAPMYLIGDPKQAIYGFRGADLHTYLEARDAAAAGRHTLDRNFRSDEPMVRAVNHLFSGPFPFVDARIGHQDIAARHPLRFAPPLPALEVRCLTTARVRQTLGQPGGDAQPVNKDDARRAILRHLAQDLVDFLQSGTVRTGVSQGPVRPGDLAVLVRTNRQATEVQKALGRVGLPSVVSSSGDVFGSATAAELALLLAAVEARTDLGALGAALATPLLGVDAGIIAQLDGDDDLRERWGERLRRWQGLWLDKGVLQMLRAIQGDAVAADPLDSTREVSIPERLLSLPDGERRLTDLLHLTELAHAAATAGSLQPAGVLAWLAQQRAREGDTDEGRELRLETDAASVQIVTMHKCKGLQYPFVWLPYAWEGHREPDSDDLLFHDPAHGERLTLDLRLDAGDPAKVQHASLALLEAHAESLRLLYVALTRAEHRTVVYAGNFKSYGTAPLAWLLHRRAVLDRQPGATPGILREAVQTYVDAADEAALLDDMRTALSDAAAMAVTEVGQITTRLWHDDAAPPPALRSREFPPRRRLDTWWRRASYTALVGHGREADDRAARRQLENADPEPRDAVSPVPDVEPAVPDDAPDVPLAGFSRGKDAGNFLHKVMELHDFTQERGDPRLEQLVATELRQHGLAVDDAGRAGLIAGLDRVLDTPLGLAVADLRLRDLAPHNRLNELDFDLPVVGAGDEPGSVTSAQVAAVLRRTRAPGSPLSDAYLDRVEHLDFFPPLRGFLSGSIDLVFTADVQGRRRWYLADYKSNWLGDGQGESRRCTAWHYRRGRMQTEMEHAHYFLQYHLYTVALHRWLTWRMPGYDYDRDFGGCLYLFVRGMVGPEALRTGVFFDRPPLALVAGLSQLLSSGGAT